MLKKIMNTNINYEYYDIKNNITLVLLHGWGQNIEMMKPVGDRYKKYFNVLYVDLPGFGKSGEPDCSWSVYDYADALKELFDYLDLKDIILIGHSFGGRISLIYSSNYKVKKLICFASPYCRELNKLPLKTKIYKKLKQIPGLKWISSIMKNFIGSTDYKNASEVMKGILVKSINVDMESDVKKIECPTLLIWGRCDTAVPLKRAYELKNLIKDSGVVVYDDGTHYAYLEHLNEVTRVLDSFFNIER